MAVDYSATPRHAQEAGDAFRLSQGVRRDMDRLFEDLERRRGWLASMPWGDAFVSDIEVLEEGRRAIIRSDLPGMKKDDVKVDVAGGRVTIEGAYQRGRDAKRDHGHQVRTR